MLEMTQTHRPRRNMELLLLLLSSAMVMAAYWQVDTVMLGALSPDFWFSQILFVALPLVVHIVLRIRAKYADPFLLPLASTLNGLGLVMIHRLDIPLGSHDASRQLIWMALSVAAASAILLFLQNTRRLARFTYLSLAGAFVLLLLPLVPLLGVEINGARLWINVGFGTFQPGEVAKILLAIFFAGYLSSNRDLILLAGRKIGPMQFPRFQDLAPVFIAWVLSLGVLLSQNDLGSSALFFGLFVVMIYVATGRISWVVIGLVFVSIGGLLAYKFVSHATHRIDAWRLAFTEDVYYGRGGSQQIVQGIFGLANGGLFGTGLGQGRPDIVTYANSDMIIASLGEELGLIGMFAIIMMFLLLVSRGLRAALGTKDAFSKLLGAGLSFLVALQFFIIAAGVTRLAPLTGLTTPFMSAGGSSLLANWMILALLLLVSQNARKPVVDGPMAEVLMTSSRSGFFSRSRRRAAALEAERTATDVPEEVRS